MKHAAIPDTPRDALNPLTRAAIPAVLESRAPGVVVANTNEATAGLEVRYDVAEDGMHYFHRVGEAEDPVAHHDVVALLRETEVRERLRRIALEDPDGVFAAPQNSLVGYVDDVHASGPELDGFAGVNPGAAA